MDTLVQSLPLPLTLLGVMYVLQVVNSLSGHVLNQLLGIRPRRLWGIVGIPCSPFLHAGWGHLLSNTIPFLVLGALVVATGQWLTVTLFVAVVGGALVWLIGRSGVTVGASGLIFGFFGFLVADGFVSGDRSSLITAVIVVLVYGGLITGIVPRWRSPVSWQAHLGGLAAGAWVAWLLHTGGLPDALVAL
ncbi:rhomboid family intramembrane serine protease [Micrococcales bacterium 31B]|nr:rhomboid family intramembrane serine protease [Micrococcales bacterium 31B]